METVSDFKNIVHDFMRGWDMAPTTFGRLFANDPNLVSRLDAGREPRESTRKKILQRMEEYSGQ